MGQPATSLPSHEDFLAFALQLLRSPPKRNESDRGCDFYAQTIAYDWSCSTKMPKLAYRTDARTR